MESHSSSPGQSYLLSDNLAYGQEGTIEGQALENSPWCGSSGSNCKKGAETGGRDATRALVAFTAVGASAPGSAGDIALTGDSDGNGIGRSHEALNVGILANESEGLCDTTHIEIYLTIGNDGIPQFPLGGRLHTQSFSTIGDDGIP